MDYIRVMTDCNALQEGFHNFEVVGLSDSNYSIEDLATIALEMGNRGYKIAYDIKFGEKGLEIYVQKR